MNVALIGSVSSSYTALTALIGAKVAITAVLGLDESQAENVCDYRSLGELADRACVEYTSFVGITDPHVEPFLRLHQPDLLWVIGLSQLVPDRLIRIARHGGVGFHPTMLPRGRGRAPVAWTILLGKPAAASLFFLTDKPDAGDIIAQREVAVLPDDYSEDLIARTNEVLHEVIGDLAPRIKDGNLPRSPQDHARATYYAKRTPADGLIDWSKPTDQIYRLVRAAGRPYRGAFTNRDATARERARVIIWRARPARTDEVDTSRSTAKPGTVLRVEPGLGPLVRTVDGCLWLTETVVEDERIAGSGGTLEAGIKLGDGG